MPLFHSKNDHILKLLVRIDFSAPISKVVGVTNQELKEMSNPRTLPCWLIINYLNVLCF